MKMLIKHDTNLPLIKVARASTNAAHQDWTIQVSDLSPVLLRASSAFFLFSWLFFRSILNPRMAIDERVESRLAKWQEGLNKVIFNSINLLTWIYMLQLSW